MTITIKFKYNDVTSDQFIDVIECLDVKVMP